MTPRVLDLFCGGGGASRGYYAAGFDVVGVDVRRSPGYPFPLILADALTVDLAGFDLIHASPPCQAHTALRSMEGAHWRLFDVHPDLVAATRRRLAWAATTYGTPHVIENVPRAPVRADLTLCGSQFGLGARCLDGAYRQLRRHRIFELAGFTVRQPACRHQGEPIGVYGHGGLPHVQRQWAHRRRGYSGVHAERAAAMGVELSPHDLAEAIPPAYTRHIGAALLAAVDQGAAALDSG